MQTDRQTDRHDNINYQAKQDRQACDNINYCHNINY